MSVPSSGPVSLADIRSEFGAPAGTPLHDFVRGGSWVPETATNSGAPAAPPVSIDDLRGASAAAAPPATSFYVTAPAIFRSVSLGGQSYWSGQVGGSTATPHNATGSVSFSWAWVDNTPNFTVVGSGSATLLVNASNLPQGRYTATVRVTAKDSSGSATADVSVTLNVGP